jgi:hypothetical protein
MSKPFSSMFTIPKSEVKQYWVNGIFQTLPPPPFVPDPSIPKYDGTPEWRAKIMRLLEMADRDDEDCEVG